MIRYLAPLLMLALVLGCGGSGPERPQGPPPGGKADSSQLRQRPPEQPPQKELTPEEQLNKTMQELTPRLKMKPAQADKVRIILKSSMTQKQKLEEQQGATRNVEKMITLFELLHKVDQNTMKALSKVLNSDQMEEYLKYCKEQRKRLGGLAAPSKGGGPPRGSMGGMGKPGSSPPNRP